MKNIFTTILISTIFGINLVAQSSYNGGNGDGYAAASFNFQTVGLNETPKTELQIFPSILSKGASFIIKRAKDVKDIELVNINGQVWNLGTKMVIPNTVQGGIYSLRIKQEDELFIVRIAIVN